MKTKRTLIALLAAILGAVSALSLVMVLRQEDHQCIDVHCHLCIEVQAWRSFVRDLSYLGVAFVVLRCVCGLSIKVQRCVSNALTTNSLVFLKVKLLN